MRSTKGRAKRPVFIFDFGGVVIKWKNNNPIFDYVADRYGIPRAEMRRVFELALPRLESGEVSMRDFLEEALGKFGKRLRKGDSPDELWTLPFERLAKFRVGTVRLVKSLRRRGYEVYLFSNTSYPHVRFMRRVGWDELFDGFLSSCELRSLKPTPLAFARALEEIKVAPSEAVFIDDKEENVRGAEDFGIRWAFRFTSLARLRRDVAKAIYAVPTRASRHRSLETQLMVDAKRIERKVSVVEHGFKPILEEAQGIAAESSVPESMRVAKELYASDNYQVRMVAVFVLGYVAARSPEAFRMLREKVSADGSWQVQEVLAQAFNQYCQDIGYERALPTIKDWLGDKSPNARRAVTEGLRIWNRREYFKQHPDVAVGMLAQLKGDESEYVRRSVGNAIRDISKREKALVKMELATWDTSDEPVAFTYALANKFL